MNRLWARGTERARDFAIEAEELARRPHLKGEPSPTPLQISTQPSATIQWYRGNQSKPWVHSQGPRLRGGGNV